MNRADRIAKRIKKGGVKSLKLRFLGKGISRSVYYNRRTRTVFKVGMKFANRSEWNFYRLLPTNVKNLFARPTALSACGSVLEMEFVDFVFDTFDCSAISFKLCNTVDRKLKKLKLYDIVTDIHPANIGVDKNRKVKIVDYASLNVEGNSREHIKEKLVSVPNSDATIKLKRKTYEKVLSTKG